MQYNFFNESLQNCNMFKIDQYKLYKCRIFSTPSIIKIFYLCAIYKEKPYYTPYKYSKYN